MSKDIIEQLDDLIEEDEAPLSNHTFARIMKPFFNNHLPHMNADIKQCKFYIKIFSGALGIGLMILLAILGILLSSPPAH